MYGPQASSVRRLWVLVSRLGPDSRYAKATGRWWTHDREVAAQHLEVAHADWRFNGGHLEFRQGQVPKPMTVPRPGQEPAAKSPIQRVRDMFLRGGGR